MYNPVVCPDKRIPQKLIKMAQINSQNSQTSLLHCLLTNQIFHLTSP